jgi:hypothetical protein
MLGIREFAVYLMYIGVSSLSFRVPIISSFSFGLSFLISAYLFFKDTTSSKISLREVAIVSLPFILSIFGLFITDDLTGGLELVARKLPIIIIPITFSLLSFSLKELENTLKLFSVGALISVVVNIITILVLYYLGITNEFSYSSFTQVSSIHTTYYGVMLVIAVFVIVLRFEIRGWIGFFLWLISIFVLSTGLVINGAKIVMLPLFIALLLTGYKAYLFRKKTMVFILSVVVMGLILVINSTAFQHRIGSVKMAMNDNEMAYSGGDGLGELFGSEIALKVEGWKSNVKVLHGVSFIIGNGTNGGVSLRNDGYTKDGLSAFKKSNYNSHSMYVETLYQYGVFGLAIFISSIIIILFWVIRTKDLTLVAIWFTIILAMVTESFLERQLGVMIYGLFGAMVLVKKDK